MTARMSRGCAGRWAAVAFIVLALAGCASGPVLKDLRQGVQSATLVQQGKTPLLLQFGVVDTTSWWAANGDAVGNQTGGWLWSSIAAGARTDELDRAPTQTRIMERLFDNHPLADIAISGILPELARAWSVPYSPEKVLVVNHGVLREDEQGYLLDPPASTDLILVASMPSLRLTEKVTMGAAFRAGFSLGTHTKEVTAEPLLAFRAYRLDAKTGRYKNIWQRHCMLTNMNMDTAIPFPDLVAAPEKAKVLWDEAAPKLVALCSGVLQQWANENPS